MGSIARLRIRRSAAQLHALAQLEREIRASDPHTRRKYLRDFNSAFRHYESVLDLGQLATAVREADVLLVGDYHALAKSQRFAAGLVRQIATERPVVVGLEMIFARDQNLLDAWHRGEFDARELRERIRFDLDWGYDWEPFYELLESSRAHALATYGLDCTPRNDLRRIGMRDRHAAARLAEVRDRHPEATLVVLFGESHLAPNHLPELLHALRPTDRILTVLQNVDNLYWQAAGERNQPVEAVRVSRDVVCVFNSTPLEKYESYRLCLDRWRAEHATTPDLAPLFNNIVGALLRFLNLGPYPASVQTQLRLVVDQLPPVYWRPSERRVRRLLARKVTYEAEIETVLDRLEHQGCCYVPEAGAMLVSDFHLAHGAQEAARFLHYVWRGSSGPCVPASEDSFYTRVIEEALAYFGSRALCPALPPVREFELYAKYSLTQEAVEAIGIRSYREFMHLLDFLVTHKDYEANLRHYRECPQLLTHGVRCEGEAFRFLTRQLGYMLGSDLYDAYLAGRIAKRFLRSLFSRRLDKPGASRSIYFGIQRRLRRSRRPV
jgi:hypothetical protein